MSDPTHSAVALHRDGEIAVITVDSPPVNALSRAVRAGIVECLETAARDSAVKAIVLRCAGRTFIAGADVTEFVRPPEPPFVPDLVQAIEGATKPVVAAIHGTALGGGFEVALATHYRIALASAKVGLPEVKLGVLPGAGGTQRLPRLIGAPAALRWIVEGTHVPASEALRLGAVDEVVEDGLDAAAMTAARRLGAGGAPLRRTGSLPVPPLDAAALAEVEAGVQKRQRGLDAPAACIEAVRAATRVPLEKGMRLERELFLKLRTSAQSLALRHAFFGEREVAKVPGIGADIAARPVRTVAVIGAGTMGGGIAMCFANAGIPVTILESDAQALDRGMGIVRKNYAATAARGGMTEAERDRRMGLIRPTLDYADLAQADLVIEAVFEDIDVKRGVFGRLDAVAKPGAVLASNTSYLDIGKIASFTHRPADVVGMHFFSPANVMRLLENVRAPQTAPDVLATVMKVGKTIGKVAVMVGTCDGFVGNRMLAKRTREAFFLLEEGALPQQVDRVLTAFGFPMGPFAVGDLAGLDVGWRNRQSRAHLRSPAVRDCNLLDQVYALGRYGQKTAAGWYRYEAGSRTPIADPAIEALIVAHSERIGMTRRAIGDDEILERCLYSMVNEAAFILEEGIAARPVDVDMIWLHGYGFPAWRGGPLFWADQVGLAKVLEGVEKYRAKFGDIFWKPAPWLVERAAAGRGFYPS